MKMLAAAGTQRNFHGWVEQVAGTLRDSSGSERVVIQHNPIQDGIGISTYGRIRSVWNRFWHGSAFKRENLATGRFLFQMFGVERVTRIFKRCGIDLQDRFRNGFKQRDIKRLFVHMGDIRFEDLTQIYRDIILCERGSYLHLSEEEVQSLREHFRNRRFEQLTKRDLDELYDIAVPFRSLETMFLHRMSKLDTNPLVGSAFAKLRRRVYHVERFRRGQMAPMSQDLFDYHKMKEIINLSTPVGLVIPEVNGYRCVAGVLHGRMNAVFLKPIGRPRATYRNQIAVLATQMTRIHTWIEDIRPEIGSRGVMDRHSEIHRLLHDPSRGFVDDPNEMVDLLGYSLGGAQAQRLATCFHKKIHKLTLICSPQIDRSTADRFSKRVARDRRQDPIEIHIIMNHRDRISGLGNNYVGHGAVQGVKLRVSVLQEGRNELTPREYLQRERAHYARQTSRWRNPLRIMKSLFTSHRANFLLSKRGCTIHRYGQNDADQLAVLTTAVTTFERARRIFEIFFRKTGESFSRFLEYIDMSVRAS